MDDRTKKLVALGASAAANCRPCLEYHLGEARAAAVDVDDIATAIEIGLGVNEGAARRTREFALGDLLEREPAAAVASGGGCC